MSFTKSPRLCSQRKNTSRFPPTPKCSTACCSTGFTFPPKTAGRTSVGASINSLPSKRRRIPCSAAPTAGQNSTGRRRRKAAAGSVPAKTAARCLPQHETASNTVPMIAGMQHKSRGRAHERKPCERLRTRKKRKQHKKRRRRRLAPDRAGRRFCAEMEVSCVFLKL